MLNLVAVTTWRRCAISLALSCVAVSGCGSSPISPPPPSALVLTCPAAHEAPTVGGAAVPISYPLPSSTGGSGSVNVSCVPPSGSMFEVGTTPVNCTATDTGGRTAGCSFLVRVVDVPRLTLTRFLVFGDSLTEGKLSALVESPPHSYAAKLQHMLEDRYSGQSITLLNEGHGGESAVGSLSRFRSVMSTHRPEVVLLLHGVNDLNSRGLPGVQRAVDAIEELVKYARDNAQSTFVATLPPLGPGPKAGCPECVEPFNARLRSMAAAKGAELVDVHAAWGTRPGLMGADGIHPTEAGYEVIAQAFFDAIRRTLEATGPTTP